MDMARHGAGHGHGHNHGHGHGHGHGHDHGNGHGHGHSHGIAMAMAMAICLQTKVLLEAGVGAIPHGQDDTFYTDMLTNLALPSLGGPRPEAESDLEVDVDDGGPLALEGAADDPMESDDDDSIVQEMGVALGIAPASGGGSSSPFVPKSPNDDGDDDEPIGAASSMPKPSWGTATPIAAPTCPAPASPLPGGGEPCLGGGVEHGSPPLDEDGVDVLCEFGVLESGRWGVFTITPRQPGAHGAGAYGGFQAACPFHKKNTKSGCRKWIRIEGPSLADKRRTAHQLMWWCVQATDFKRQRDHLDLPTDYESCPPIEAVLSFKITDPPPPGTVLDDVTLDRIDETALDALPLASLLPAGGAPGPPPPEAAGPVRGRGRGRGRAGRGRGGRGADAAKVSSDEAGPSSSDAGGSASSSSSSSSSDSD